MPQPDFQSGNATDRRRRQGSAPDTIANSYVFGPDNSYPAIGDGAQPLRRQVAEHAADLSFTAALEVEATACAGDARRGWSDTGDCPLVRVHPPVTPAPPSRYAARTAPPHARMSARHAGNPQRGRPCSRRGTVGPARRSSSSARAMGSSNARMPDVADTRCRASRTTW